MKKVQSEPNIGFDCTFKVGPGCSETMKTLLTLFSEGRNELQAEIDKAIDLEQVIKLVHNQIDNLERIYVGQLSLAQVRLVNFFLETLRQSVATLTAANATKSDPVG